MWLGKWAEAHVNIQKSIELILDTDWDSINTDELFDHYALRAEAEIKLGKVKEALLTLNYARLIAPSKEQEAIIQQKINWINWDSGNLENSHKYDEVLEKLKSTTDYSKIKQNLLDLLRQTSSENARNEINWQLARIEFQYLDQREKAISRLFELIQHIEYDTAVTPMNPQHQKYIEDYCKMCYNMGMHFVDEQKLRHAFVYFLQSIRYEWAGMGKSYLQLALLASSRHEYALDYCQKAFQCADQLSLNEISDLYHLLFVAHTAQGNFPEAKRWYQQWTTLQH